jgi:hypothetical protein
MSRKSKAELATNALILALSGQKVLLTPPDSLQNPAHLAAFRELAFNHDHLTQKDAAALANLVRARVRQAECGPMTTLRRAFCCTRSRLPASAM